MVSGRIFPANKKNCRFCDSQFQKRQFLIIYNNPTISVVTMVTNLLIQQHLNTSVHTSVITKSCQCKLSITACHEGCLNKMFFNVI